MASSDNKFTIESNTRCTIQSTQSADFKFIISSLPQSWLQSLLLEVVQEFPVVAQKLLKLQARLSVWQSMGLFLHTILIDILNQYLVPLERLKVLEVCKDWKQSVYDVHTWSGEFYAYGLSSSWINLKLLSGYLTLVTKLVVFDLSEINIERFTNVKEIEELSICCEGRLYLPSDVCDRLSRLVLNSHVLAFHRSDIPMFRNLTILTMPWYVWLEDYEYGTYPIMPGSYMNMFPNLTSLHWTADYKCRYTYERNIESTKINRFWKESCGGHVTKLICKEVAGWVMPNLKEAFPNLLDLIINLQVLQSLEFLLPDVLPLTIETITMWSAIGDSFNNIHPFANFIELVQELPKLGELIVSGDTYLSMRMINMLPVNLVSHWHIQRELEPWSREYDMDPSRRYSLAFCLKEMLLFQDMLPFLFDRLYTLRIDHLIMIPRRLGYMKKRSHRQLIYSMDEKQNSNQNICSYLTSKCNELEPTQHRQYKQREPHQSGHAKLDIKSVTCAIDLSPVQRQLFERFILKFSTCVQDQIFYNMTPDVEKYW